MANTPIEVVRLLLDHSTNSYVVNALVARDATYSSLNLDTGDLKRILPWARSRDEPGELLQTLIDVDRHWTNEVFEITDMFGQGGKVAAFGSFTYRSTILGKRVTSAIAIFATVADGKVTHMRFMEDTFTTARSFRPGGTWTIQVDPDGTTAEI